MTYKNFNIWYLLSFLISFIVLIPIITVFTSFFESTSNYYEILKNTFLIEYILNSLVLLISVLVLTFLLGTGTAYLVSFYKIQGRDFFKRALIISFAASEVTLISITPLPTEKVSANNTLLDIRDLAIFAPEYLNLSLIHI